MGIAVFPDRWIFKNDRTDKTPDFSKTFCYDGPIKKTEE